MAAKQESISDEDVIKIYGETQSIPETAKMLGTTYSLIANRVYRLGIRKVSKKQKPSVKTYALSPLGCCEGGISIKRDKLDGILKLKEGMKIKVKVNERYRIRTIKNIYKHHVLCVDPKTGTNECFTKAEIFVNKYGEEKEAAG